MTMHVDVETIKSDVDYCLVQMPVCAMEPFCEEIPATFEIDRDTGCAHFVSATFGGLTLTEDQFKLWVGADEVRKFKEQCEARWVEQTDEGQEYKDRTAREEASL